MYVKIFGKILDSSIWLAPSDTRVVWITLLAHMDAAGFAEFASVRNLARRAGVTDKAAAAAIKALEGPDPDSSDPEFDGRRIERVQGGWMVLNALKYRELGRKETKREQTARRAKEFRDRHRAANVTDIRSKVSKLADKLKS
jgi:hypothetical protein